MAGSASQAGRSPWGTRFLAVCAVLVATCARAAAEEPASASGTDVASLRAELAAPEVGRRQKAAYALWKLGPAAKDAIPALATALRDADEYVRNTANKVLWDQSRTFGALQAAIPELLVALADPRVEVRRLGAGTLWRSGWHTGPGKANPALGPALSKALDDPDPGVRAAAASVVGNYGPWVKEAHPALLRHVKDPDRDVRLAVIRALRSSVGDERVAPLVGVLNDPDPQIRAAAAGSLGVFTGKGRLAVPGLVRALRDEDPSVREAAAGAFVEMSGQVPAPEAVPALLGMLEDDAPQTRTTAAMALGQLGDPRALDALVKRAVDDVDPGVRIASTRAIGGLGPEGGTAFEVLRALLKDSEVSVAMSAVHSLAAVGTDLGAVEGVLRGALGSSSPVVRSAVASALGWLPTISADTVLALAAMFGDPGNVMMASTVATSIRRHGPRAAPAVPALVEALDGPREAVLDYVVPALQAVGPAAHAALPKLRSLTSGAAQRRLALATAVAAISGLPEDAARAVTEAISLLESAPPTDAPDERYKAAYALAALGESARAARGALALRFVEADTGTRAIFAHALVAIDAEKSPAAWEAIVEAAKSRHDYAIDALVRALPARRDEVLPILLAAASADQAWTRTAAVEALGRAGIDSPEVREALLAARKDPSGPVRTAAARALRARELENGSGK
jgi:HEAT repeat protein